MTNVEPSGLGDAQPSGAVNLPRNAAQGVQQQLLKRARTGNDSRDPFRQLTKLELPSDIHTILETPLKELGFTITRRELSLPYDNAIRGVTLASRASGESLVMIHIPKWLLGSTDGKYKAAVVELQYLFPHDSQIIIVSKALDVPELAYTYIFELWSRSGIHVTFLAWRQIKGLSTMTASADALATLLQVSRAPKAVLVVLPSPAALKPRISEVELQRVAAFLTVQASSAVVEPADFVRSVVDELALPDAWKNDAIGVDGTAASNSRLVTWASSRGEYPPPHAYAGQTVLGMLIDALLKRVGRSPDSTAIFQIGEANNLISGARIAELRAVYAPAEDG